MYLGRIGLYSLAVLMGVIDVDPLIPRRARSGPVATAVRTAAAAIVIAAASNDVIKAAWAYAFADRATGLRSLAMLLAFALLGLMPLAFL